MEIIIQEITQSEFDDFIISSKQRLVSSYISTGFYNQKNVGKAVEKSYSTMLVNGKETPNMLFKSIYVESLLVGHMWFCLPIEKGESILLADIEVNSGFQGKGVATFAIEWLEKYASKEKYSGVRLQVFHGNEKAEKLYEKLGFNKIATSMFKKVI